ncbi:hypothetical protein AB0B45_51510 [Nonomuraea sp. NPDC049152]|uniref:hypothetical protein n=1 Tax=Nonomuraea sp. NPDC049152 TaxID=3154350 RepID=UPI0033E5CAB9
MRIGSLVLAVWLIIGALAAGQRGHYTGSVTNCNQVATIAVTILGGPLNYVGLNPKIACETPKPSK